MRVTRNASRLPGLCQPLVPSPGCGLHRKATESGLQGEEPGKLWAGCVCKSGETEAQEGSGSSDLGLVPGPCELYLPGGSCRVGEQLQTMFFQPGLRWCLPLPPLPSLPLWGSDRNLRSSLPLSPTCKLSADPVASPFIVCLEFPLPQPCLLRVLPVCRGLPVNT